MHGRYDLDQLRWIAAPLGPDHSNLDAVQLDAIAFALAKSAALLDEALDFDRLPPCRKGLPQQHIQGSGKGNEAQVHLELAAVALTGEEVLALPEAG